MEIDKLQVIKIYKEVLGGKKRKQFPRGFWQNSFEVNKIISDIILKFLFEELLGWTKEDIIEKLNKDIFTEYKINYIYIVIHKLSLFYTINSVYPNIFKPWQFGLIPQNYWTDENKIDALKWLVNKKLKLDLSNIVINKKIFAELF